MRTTLFIAAGLAAPMLTPAFAADAVRQPPVAERPIAWADLSLAMGIFNLKNSSCGTACEGSGHVVLGQGRLGWRLPSSNTSVQFDVSGEGSHSDQTSLGNVVAFNAAGHLTWDRDPSHTFGIMAAYGVVGPNADRWWTIAAEGALTFEMTSRLVVQAGWSKQLQDTGTAPYIHAFLQHELGGKVCSVNSVNVQPGCTLLTGDVGYAAPSSDAGNAKVWRYGLRLDHGFTERVAGFVAWQGITSHDANNPQNNAVDNRFLVGATFSIVEREPPRGGPPGPPRAAPGAGVGAPLPSTTCYVLNGHMYCY